MAKTIIIGAGVSGLCAGIFALEQGNDVTICDMQQSCGGNLTGWSRGEYHIDNCIHWLTGTDKDSSLYRLWKEVGAIDDGQIYQPEILFSTMLGTQKLSLWLDFDKTISEMLFISPSDEREIRLFGNAVKSMMAFTGSGKGKNGKKANFLQKSDGVLDIARYFSLSTADLAKKFQNKLLKRFFTDIMGDAFSSIAFIVMCATFCSGNGGLPKGGSFAMAQRMKEKFLSLGGKLILSTAVKKINIENSTAISVVLSDGNVLFCDYIIATQDPKALFGKLIDVKMPKRLEKMYRKKGYQRFSSVHCAFSCDSDLIGFSGDLIIEPPEYIRQLGLPNIVLREFRHEKSFAPEGKTVLQAMCFCTEEECLNYIFLRGADKKTYMAKKKHVSALITCAIEEVLPELKDRISLIDTWTPATYKRYTGADIGSYMSFTMPSGKIPRKISNRVKGCENLILAGQWLQCPGGLPIALRSGERAVKTIMKIEERKKLLSKSHGTKEVAYQ